jgi:hypothetical protein
MVMMVMVLVFGQVGKRAEAFDYRHLVLAPVLSRRIGHGPSFPLVRTMYNLKKLVCPRLAEERGGPNALSEELFAGSRYVQVVSPR